MPGSGFHHALAGTNALTLLLGFGLGCFLVGMGVGGIAIVWLL